MPLFIYLLLIWKDLYSLQISDHLHSFRELWRPLAGLSVRVSWVVPIGVEPSSLGQLWERWSGCWHLNHIYLLNINWICKGNTRGSTIICFVRIELAWLKDSLLWYCSYMCACLEKLHLAFQLFCYSLSTTQVQERTTHNSETGTPNEYTIVL